MGEKETFHLPGATLEIEFSDAPRGEYDFFHSLFKERLMKRLIADGSAFKRNDHTGGHRKAKDTAEAAIEASVDAFILECSHTCAKTIDKQTRKVRWIIDAEERVTILLLPKGE